MHDKQQELRQLLVLFLQVNCEPSDDQFHALAHSLGCDKETLESIAYEMLGEEVEHEHEEQDEQELHELVEGVSTHFPEGEEVEDFGVVNAAFRLTVTAGMDDEYGEEGLSEQQEVLQGEGDTSTMNADDLTLMDGAPVGQSTDDEMQDAELVDGVGEDDTGIGFEADKTMLLNDGAPALQMKNAALASARRLTAAQEMEVFGRPASHLSKKRGTAEQLAKVADHKPNKVVGISIASPKGKQGFWFLGGAAGLKFKTPIRFKNTRGVVDFIGDIDKEGNLVPKSKESAHLDQDA